jgi:hypothetical protein
MGKLSSTPVISVVCLSSSSSSRIGRLTSPAEPWWVNSLVRHPILLPYTLGSKRLDKIYLDSTFARASHIYRTFPSKAEGLAELLQKVASYPDDTVFYFRAWTFGYEEVWMALSASLNSKVRPSPFSYLIVAID